MSDYGRELEFGASVEPLADPPDWAARVTRAAERSGLNLVGIQDHPYQRRFLNTWTLISTLAPITERVRFFPDAANLPLRPHDLEVTLDTIIMGLDAQLGASESTGEPDSA